MRINFISLASGSSGNCYYLGTSNYGILIDAGIGPRKIKKILKSYDIDLEQVIGVFVTHDHADHIMGVGYLNNKGNIPVYTTKECLEGINEHPCTKHKITHDVVLLSKEETTSVKDFKITPFDVPHDCTDSVGYFIEIDNKSFCLLTDAGEITGSAPQYICKANYLIIESNYDEEMLRTGKYPQQLKERVSGHEGHLSNKETANFVANHISKKLEHIWLCHISGDNNTLDCAYETMEYALREKDVKIGKDVFLTALEKKKPSELFTFE